MLKSNLGNELKKILIDMGISQTELAGGLNVSRQSLNNLIAKANNGSLTPAMINVFEHLGYDIELKIVPRS